MSDGIWRIVVEATSIGVAGATLLGAIASFVVAAKISNVLRFLISRSRRIGFDEAAIYANAYEGSAYRGSIIAAFTFLAVFALSGISIVAGLKVDDALHSQIENLGGQMAAMKTVDRHILPEARRRFAQAIGIRSAMFKLPIVVLSSNDPETNGYALEIMTTLRQAGLPTNGQIPGTMRAFGSQVEGIYFEVPDPNNPPDQVRVLMDAFGAINIATRLAPTSMPTPESYALVVARP